MEFFEQLKERRLVRITLAYLAGGWIALQAFDQFTTQGILPGVAYELALIWYLVGIPIALVLGWYHGEKGHQRATKLEIFVLVVLLAAGITASVPTVSDELARRMRLEAAAESELDLRRVAVLYLDDVSPDSAARHVADGLTESLIEELSTVQELDVVSANGVWPYRGSEVPYDSVARALDAGTLVDGTVEQTGDRIRVNVRLVDGTSGADLPERAAFERPASELLSARAEVVEGTARLLRRWIGDELRLRRTRAETGSVRAWALLHRGNEARKDAEEALDRRDVEAAFAALDRADTALARAEVLDSAWVEPPTLRGRVAYERARVEALRGNRRGSVDRIESGLEHAGRALELDATHAPAFEVRGALKYLHHLLDVVPDPERQARLIEEAEADLERAVDLDPGLATAHAMLSHLYSRRHRETDMVLAARTAYEEDAYLDNADRVLFYLANGNYNLENFTEARRWCATGQRRFPSDHRFAQCELLLMTTPAVAPDPDRAWELVARVDTLAPGHQAEWEALRARLLAGGVLARAGLTDSAASVWRTVRESTDREVDPDRELRMYEAYMRTLADDHGEAIDLLKTYAAVNPDVSYATNWWWDELRDHPRWSELSAATSPAGPTAH